MIMFGSFLPSPLLVWRHKVYSGWGADIVMESFHSLTCEKANRRRMLVLTLFVTVETNLQIAYYDGRVQSREYTVLTMCDGDLTLTYVNAIRRTKWQI
jgi:hypothetical protein